MAGQLGSLVVSVGADIRRLRGDLGRAQRQVDRAMAGIRRSAALAAQAIAAVGIGLAGVLSAGAFNEAIAQTAALADAADKLGQSAESIQEYRFAAAQVGVAQNTVDLAIQRFTRRVGEAVQGTGELKGILEQYNIELQNADGTTRDINAVLADLADATKGASSAQEQLRIAFKAFDSEGAALVNVLRLGSEGIETLKQSARDAGAVIDESLVRRAKELDDRLTALAFTIETKLKAALLTIAVNVDQTFNPKQVFDFGDALDENRRRAVELREELEELRRTGSFGQGSFALVNELAQLEARDPATTIERSTERLADLRAELERLNSTSAQVPDLGNRISADGAVQSQISAVTAEITQLEQTLARAQDAINRPQQQATDTSLVDQQTEAQRKRAEAIEKVAQSIEFEIEQLQRSELEQAKFNALRQAGVDLDTEAGQRIAVLVTERERLQAVNEAAIEAEEQLAAAAEKRNAVLARGARLTESLQTPQERLNALQREYDTLLAQGAITAETYGRALEKAAKDAEEAAKKTEELTDSQKAVEDAVEDLGLTFASAFEDAIVNLKDVDGIIRGLAQDILRITARIAVTQPLTQFLTSSLSGLLPGFQGGRALGGPVSAGRPVLVGENGPELLVPRGNGTVVPNHALGGAPVINIIQQAPNVAVEAVTDSQGEIDILIKTSLERQIGNGALAGFGLSPGLTAR